VGVGVGVGVACAEERKEGGKYVCVQQTQFRRFVFYECVHTRGTCVEGRVCCLVVVVCSC
jgi:hypothetical protein